MNYYEILGVKKTDDINTIKKAYKKLASKYHPDKHPGDSSYDEKFKQINQAYETLSNQDKRKEYDFSGSNTSPFGKHASPYDSHFDTTDIFKDLFRTSMHRTTRKDSNGRDRTEFHYNFNEKKEDFNGRSHNIFEDFFNDSYKENSNQRNKSEPVIVYVKLNKEEVKNGVTKEVFIEKLNKTINVRFPVDSIPGKKLKVKNKEGYEIVLKIKNFSNKWKFEGENIKMTMPFEKFKDLKEVKVKTIEGRDILVKIPEGIQPDTTLRLKGMGWAFNDGKKSDLLINIK